MKSDSFDLCLTVKVNFCIVSRDDTAQFLCLKFIPLTPQQVHMKESGYKSHDDSVSLLPNVKRPIYLTNCFFPSSIWIMRQLMHGSSLVRVTAHLFFYSIALPHSQLRANPHLLSIYHLSLSVLLIFLLVLPPLSFLSITSSHLLCYAIPANPFESLHSLSILHSLLCLFHSRSVMWLKEATHHSTITTGPETDRLCWLSDTRAHMNIEHMRRRVMKTEPCYSSTTIFVPRFWHHKFLAIPEF